MVESNFIQKKKNQKNLLFILVIVIIVIIFVIYNGFSKTEPILDDFADGNIFVPKQEIKINFDVLNDPVLKGLQPFLEIQSLELATGTEIGRENPFIPF
ncbi:MAG: hypothetical protein ABID67_02325 [Candidatus Nealsonbacteria bacterium]